MYVKAYGFNEPQDGSLKIKSVCVPSDESKTKDMYVCYKWPFTEGSESFALQGHKEEVSHILLSFVLLHICLGKKENCLLCEHCQFFFDMY